MGDLASHGGTPTTIWVTTLDYGHAAPQYLLIDDVECIAAELRVGLKQVLYVVVGGDDAKEGKHTCRRPAIYFTREPSRLRRYMYGGFRGLYKVQHIPFDQ